MNIPGMCQNCGKVFQQRYDGGYTSHCTAGTTTAAMCKTYKWRGECVTCVSVVAWTKRSHEAPEGLVDSTATCPEVVWQATQ